MTAKHEPTPETRLQVKTLASVGTPQDQIAIVVGITKNTLLKYYRKELDTAMTMANAKVAQSLFQQATAGNTSAAIFWLKCRARWSDKNDDLSREKLQLEIEQLKREANPSKERPPEEDYRLPLECDEDMPNEPIL